MSSAYIGTRGLLEELGLSTNEELGNIVLNPLLYKELWEKARQHAGNHDYHDLTLLHDTLCFMYYRGGKLTKEGILELKDDFQDVSNYVEQCIIPALRDLGLVELILDDDAITLTKKRYELKPSPRFVELNFDDEDQ